jgi:hypothetical protein
MSSLSAISGKHGAAGPVGGREGFALVTALLAVMILMALGFLALSVTTGDLKVSRDVAGEKKAFAAAETGIHRLMQGFDPAVGMGTLTLPDGQQNANTWQDVDSATDPASRYSVGTVSRPGSGPDMLPLVGYSMGGGQSWGQRRYITSVTGANSHYNSSVQIDVGMGYGPIEISTMSR